MFCIFYNLITLQINNKDQRAYSGLNKIAGGENEERYFGKG